MTEALAPARPSRAPRLIDGTAIASFVLAAAGVGVAAARATTLTCVVAILVAAILVIVAIPRVGLWAAFVAPLAVGGVSPLGGLACLAVILTVVGVQHRGLLHPVCLFGIPVALYMVIGGANISTYRGTVSGETLTVILHHVLALLAGAAVVAGTRLGPLQAGRTRLLVAPEWRALAVLPGLLGIALAFGSAGFAIAHPYTRANIGGLPLLLAESLQAALVLFACHAFSRDRTRARDAAALAALVLGLAMPGYRGWPVIGILLAVICAVYFGRMRLTPTRVGALALIVVLIVAGGEMIRRNTAGGQAPGTQLTTQQLATRYDAEGVPPGLLELHFALRETVGLTQVLLEAHDAGRRVSTSLLLGDFKTMLPGKQTSGLVQLQEIVAIRGQLGLTAGAVGVSVMDLGWGSYFLFAGVGAALGLAWRCAPKGPAWALFYFLLVIYSIQWIHRGTPKASYVVVPIMFLFFALLTERRTSPRRMSQ